MAEEFGLKHINYTYQEGEGGDCEGVGAGPSTSRMATRLRHPRGHIIEGSIASAVADFKKQPARRQDRC